MFERIDPFTGCNYRSRQRKDVEIQGGVLSEGQGNFLGIRQAAQQRTAEIIHAHRVGGFAGKTIWPK